MSFIVLSFSPGTGVGSRLILDIESDMWSGSQDSLGLSIPSGFFHPPSNGGGFGLPYLCNAYVNYMYVTSLYTYSLLGSVGGGPGGYGPGPLRRGPPCSDGT